MDKIVGVVLSVIMPLILLSTVVLKSESETELYLYFGYIFQAVSILSGVLLVFLAVWYIYNFNSVENQSIRILKRYSRQGFAEIQLIDDTAPGITYYMLKNESLQKKVSISRFGGITEYPVKDAQK